MLQASSTLLPEKETSMPFRQVHNFVVVHSQKRLIVERG
jgi:hypothetical protein